MFAKIYSVNLSILFVYHSSVSKPHALAWGCRHRKELDIFLKPFSFPTSNHHKFTHRHLCRPTIENNYSLLNATVGHTGIHACGVQIRPHSEARATEAGKAIKL